MLAFPNVSNGASKGMQSVNWKSASALRGHLNFATVVPVVAVHVLAVFLLTLPPARKAISPASAMMVTLIHESPGPAPKRIEATQPPLSKAPQWSLPAIAVPPIIIANNGVDPGNAQVIEANMQSTAIAAAPNSHVRPPRVDIAYLNNPPPVYPALSKRLREQGKVLLRVHVSADGTAGLIEIQTSSGAGRLDIAAIAAVRQWRFVPAKRGDEAVAAWALVPVNFQLAS